MADGPAPIEQNIAPRPKWVEKIGPDGKPVVPEIKNSYGTRSMFQIDVDGKDDTENWQYGIRHLGSSDGSYPKGRFMQEKTSETSDGTVIHFKSVDDALDYALRRNREDSAKGWTDPGGEHHESDVIHYDPREKPPEDTKTT